MILIKGDCLYKLVQLESNSVDSIVTDPPYGISFMGKGWDKGVPSAEVWAECLRVLKPGGHLLCFAGTRTIHRMATNIEDAGFEIRDMIAWVYGSGFPKSLDVSKAIDKAAGAEREVMGPKMYAGGHIQNHGGGKQGYHEWSGQGVYMEDAPATPEAQQWNGWGTALKPALEPITVARKPLTGTVAANVLEWGTGAINVDGCRVGVDKSDPNHRDTKPSKSGDCSMFKIGGVNYGQNTKGRFPANLIHDGSDEVVRLFPVTTSGGGNRNGAQKGDVFRGVGDTGTPRPFPASTGSAARFFYCAKASKKDRNEGCENLFWKKDKSRPTGIVAISQQEWEQLSEKDRAQGNNHPTVKPTDIMRYLCRLVTPPGGTVLDPFMGSGSTGKAAKIEGFDFIGIELEEEYIEIARARIESV